MVNNNNSVSDPFVKFYQLEEEIRVLDRIGDISKKYKDIYALDEAISQNKPIKEIRKYIVFLKDSGDLNIKTPVHGLTPLHIAAISGHQEAVNELLKNGANPNAIDKRKWTPMHHAALLGHEKIIESLTENGADVSAYNDEGAQPSDIQRLVTQAQMTSNTVIPLLFQKDNEKSKFLTSQQYFDETHTEYLSENRVDRGVMIQNWRKEMEKPERFPFMDTIKAKYLSFTLTPQLHTLRKVIHDSSGNSLIDSPGLGLYASKKYSPETVVGEYIGIKASQMKLGSNYYLESGIDASEASNGMSRINDGFPNVVMLPMNARGMHRSVFVTAEPIHKGDQFCWNYSDHSVKLGPYEELRPKELREFIRNEIKDYGNAVDFTMKLVILGTSQQLGFEDFAKVEKFRYLLSTPAVLFNLVIEGCLTQELAEALLRMAYTFGCIPEGGPTILKSLVSIASQIRQRYEQMAKIDEQKAKEFLNSFKEMIAKHGICHALNSAQIDPPSPSSNTTKQRLKAKMDAFKQKFFNSLLDEGMKAHHSDFDNNTSIFATPNFQPINGHHPMYPERKVFPNMGRQLTPNDLHQKVVRCYPKLNGNSYDWSFIPSKTTKESAESGARVVIGFEGDKIILRNDYGLEYKIANNNDWLTVEEYLEKAPKAVPETRIEKTQDLNNNMSAFNTKVNRILSSNISKKQDDLAENDWAEKASQNIPQRSNSYYYKLPDNRMLPDEPKVEFDSDKDLARRVLNLSHNVTSQAEIKKAYLKQALRYHPDKNLNDKKAEAKFKELTKAYEKLLTSSPDIYNPEDNDSLEEAFSKANKYFSHLASMQHSINEKSAFFKWMDFNLKLSRISFDGKDPELEWHFSNLIGQCREYILCYQLKSRLEEIHFDLSNVSTPQEAAQEYAKVIANLKSLTEEFDLYNKNKKWVIHQNPLFSMANKLVLDKIIAYSRIQAECLLKLNQKTLAITLRHEISDLYKKRRQVLDSLLILANMQLAKKMHEFAKGKPKDSSSPEENSSKDSAASEDKATSEGKTENENPENVSEEKAKKKSQKKIPNVLTEEKKIDNNILENLKFFGLKEVLQ